MQLIRDVLDSQVVDHRKRLLGRVDGLVIELRPEKPPLLRWIELGWRARLSRIHPRLAHRIRSRPYRIAWSHVLASGQTVRVSIDAKESPALRLENWLRDHVIRHIPGGRA